MIRFSLVKKFSLVLLIALVTFGFSIGEIMSSAMRENMITRSKEITTHLLEHEIRNHLRLNDLSRYNFPHDYAELKGKVADLDLGPHVSIDRITIYDSEYRVVWSSDGRLPMKQRQQGLQFDAVFSGTSLVEIANSYNWAQKLGINAHANEKMDLLVPVRSNPAGEVALVLAVEATVDKLMDDIAYHNRIVWLSILSGTLLLYLVLYGLYWGAARQIDGQNRKIRMSEERYRNLIQAAEEGIVAADKTGRILLMNAAAVEMFGYGIGRDETLYFRDLFHLSNSPALTKQLAQFADKGKCCSMGQRFEAEGCRKNGEIFPLDVSLSVSGEEDKCILTGMIRDTTQRNLLMLQLAEAKQEWEETFDTINDAITIHDRDFNIVRANRAATEMLGMPLATILTQKCFRCYHGKDHPPDQCPSCETLKTGIESTSEVFETHLNKHIEVKALPRFDEHKNLSGLVHVVRDISARKEAEEKQQKLRAQLNQAQKMESVGRLAGGISHDFNNILSVIIGYSELIQRELPASSKLYKDINTIREAGEKGAVLTGQLLAFSRKQILKMRPVDLNRIVEDMTKMLRRVISENISLDLHLAPGLGMVVADAGQMEQVLLNLAVNARDAMPDGGHFIIETALIDIESEYVDQHAEAQLGPHVVLAITDTGSGMPRHVKEHIFEPFFTTKEVGKGTGLGLATVYGIVKQHGGQIYVYSEAGKGTTFKIYLPVTPNTEIEHAEPEPDSMPEGNETILIAEDDATIRQMLKSCLEPMGYTILLAADGQEAIELGRTYGEDINLLLTDVIMPGMNGQELADEITKTRPAIKVIFMSGYTDDSIAHHGVLGPGVDFIQKPITLTRLAQKLRTVLKKQ